VPLALLLGRCIYTSTYMPSEHLNISTSKAMSLVQLNNPTAVKVFLEEMLNLHRGQGMDMSLALPI